jgi:hypothetical protein
MRLGQLSRKQQVKTAEIIDILQSEYDVAINNHPNSKVPEELVAHLEDRFKKEIVLESPAEPEVSVIEDHEVIAEIPRSETPNDSEIQELPVEELEEVLIIENTPIYTNDIVDEEAELNIVDGIIKAPKIEFTGVKVVGKIDLPEKKIEAPTETLIEEDTPVDSDIDIENPEKQENVETTEISAKPATPREIEKKHTNRPAKKNQSERKDRQRRNDQPLLTPEEQRRIKLKEAQKLKLEAQKAKKEKRRATYSQELKPSNNPSSPQKKKKVVSNKTPKKQKPTSLWGRFIYWLND